MNDFPWLLVLAVGAILLLATRQYRRQRQREAQNDAAPLRIVAAEVKHKREFPRSRRRAREYQGMAVEDMLYEATFRPMTGGAPITLRLKYADYHQLDTGMQGSLQLKGTRFMRFVPQQR
ncbi:hypothetical protein BSK71_14730 [Pectobacterium actinidiae]|uniref:DUF2500 domain-containing protein n=1 Tax=Pectobacterium actinidiae TaxID=1507808 RepID=A0A1V2R1K1_9GAMM|nr:DUF2500 domain-containing protein [Pectobacterium actinidiae]GKW17497.1 hypothetical protein PEC301937_34460 [Pectobacterium carotovorum subsp. carotovorum]KHN89581.1 hypothetical protein KKH3_40820 [Pectobacterium actinidiae]MDY4316315.1 DUF2500 domain-containing protein [Pectobacterium actinidiae]ONK02783.1 hypothetical protein BSK69_15835 [Pectobacterium actinidiae]ONK04246.1 hypothetical protein BSK71_14730 [Pectobacterium actinidiae]